MGEITLNLFLLILSIALAALGGAVGAWLQQRSWVQRSWVELRETRTKRALSTVEEVAHLIDKRLFRQRQFLWAIRNGSTEEIKITKEEYRQAVFEWMDNLGRFKAQLWFSFDRYTATDFEITIHDPFARIGRALETRLRGASAGSLAREEGELNKLGKISYEFIHRLLGRIGREDLNGLTGRNKVSFENWNNLSTGFLLKRLLGIPTQ